MRWILESLMINKHQCGRTHCYNHQQQQHGYTTRKTPEIPSEKQDQIVKYMHKNSNYRLEYKLRIFLIATNNLQNKIIVMIRYTGRKTNIGI